jgi:hypothetical protein
MTFSEMVMMMRQKLKVLGAAERHTFSGVFAGVGLKTAWHGSLPSYLPTLLLTTIKLGNQEITDHLWLGYGRQFARLGELAKGDVIQFDARVGDYTKGYYLSPRQKDYKLVRPTKVSLRASAYSVHAVMPDPLDDKIALIGYIMLTNQDAYQAQGKPYSDFYVNQYRAWWRQHSS